MATATKTLSKLDVLFNASMADAKADDALRIAFVNAGGDQDEPKRILMAGRVAHSLKCSREKALQVLGMKGRGKQPDDAKLSDDVRSVPEEKACGAARVFLSGRLKAWGLKTSEGRGGDRTGDDDSMDVEKLKTPGKPKVETTIELAAYCQAFAKSGYDLFLLNKTHSAVTSKHGSELMGAFADFSALIAEINAKFPK